MHKEKTANRGKGGKESPPKPKAAPLTEAPRGSKLLRDRKTAAAELVEEISGVLVAGGETHASDSQVWPTMFAVIYEEYGRDMIEVMGERLENATVRTGDETVVDCALIILDMAMLLEEDGRVISSDDFKVLVPALMEKVDILLQTHVPGDTDDRELIEALGALDTTCDERGQEMLRGLFQNEALVDDLKLRGWQDVNGKTF